MRQQTKKWGFKVFALCASKSGLILNFEIYTGKAPVEKSRSGRYSRRRVSPVKAMESLVEAMDGTAFNSTVNTEIFDCLEDVEYSIIDLVAVKSQWHHYILKSLASKPIMFCPTTLNFQQTL